jgi:DNA-binding CsgD family transcriptional regulator
LIGFDMDLRVVVWNSAAEELMGLKAEDALGSYCWEALRGRAEDGSPLCAPSCRYAKLARSGSPVPCHRLVVPAADGPWEVSLSTITVDGDPPLFLHVICDRKALPARSKSGVADPQLTRREYQVLELLADGVPPKLIAFRLSISVATVRNHIRRILAKLQAQSQLQALARARSLGII